MSDASSIPLDDAISKVQSIADSLWVNLSQAPGEREQARIRVRRYMFVGVEPGAGTTVLAAATAMGLARNLRLEVSLVETNVAEPALAGYLNVSGTPGLSDAMDGHASLDECTRAIPACPGLHVIPAGTRRRRVPGEFATDSSRSLFQRLTSRGRYVIIDAPPLIDHPESRILLEYVDGVVLVLRARSSQSDAAQKTLRFLEEAGVPVLGSVLNRFKSDMPFGMGERDWK